MTSSLDGLALEGIFKKVKLDCESMKDPAFQLALLLHNPQNANEVFLLSLRDCLGALPASHPVRRWYNRKASREGSPVFRSVIDSLQNELKDVWGSDKALTSKQRAAIMKMLDVLDEYPPYLDFTLLQAVGYQKLGNWARAESHLRQWLALSPIDRLEKTPARRDAFSLYLRDNVETYLEALVEHGKDRFIIQIFLRAIAESVSDTRVTDKVDQFLDVDPEEVLTKLALQYHRAQVPGFSDWYLNRHLERKRRERFLDNFFATPDAAKHFWIFLGRLPDLPRHREALAKLLIDARKRHEAIFYVMATEEELRPFLQRLEPASVKNLLKERRQFFMSAYGANQQDMLALSQLVEMGQVDAALLESVSER